VWLAEARIPTLLVIQPAGSGITPIFEWSNYEVTEPLRCKAVNLDIPVEHGEIELRPQKARRPSQRPSQDENRFLHGADAEVVAYVAKTKGAIGYVGGATVAEGVKTLEVK
jgi:ABC-type phosphate transport system substrate-binding protein